MIESLRLDLAFDPAGLRADLDRIPADRWIGHFNTAGYTGVWDGVALRGPAGATHPIQSLFATPGTKEWADTDLRESSPHLDAALSRFECPLHSVRLLRLAPGAVILEHTDHALGLEDGEVRLHVPVVTNPQVDFELNGRRVTLAVGETWYMNVNLPHRVTNGGPDPRVHLVVDCAVNDWLRDLFATSDH